MPREADYVGTVRDNARALWNAINNLKSLQREWDALDYGTTLPDDTANNPGIAASEVGAVVFSTADAMITVLNAGHATNIAKLL